MCVILTAYDVIERLIIGQCDIVTAACHAERALVPLKTRDARTGYVQCIHVCDNTPVDKW